MSKKAKAREKRKKLTAKAQSRNHQRHLQYEKFSTADSAPPSSNGEATHSGKSKGRYSGTGHTKAQKKRLANGKPASGHTASYYSSWNSFGSSGGSSFFH